MNTPISAAIIGCGGRGGIYGRLITTLFPDKFTVSALCDVNPKMLTVRKSEYAVSDENCFTDEDEFFSQKRADLLIIGTQDKDHVRMTLKGLEIGYHVLVEKPIAATLEECEQLLAAQKKYGGQVFVCHVLRYSKVYTKADELMAAGEIGKLISVEDDEQIWYGHFAHSYVRGNWRNTAFSAPLLIAKSCHDLDMLQHYAGAKCESVSSVGGLEWFRAENAPEGSADRCVDCKYIDSCPYSAKKLYCERMNSRFTAIICRPKPLSEENVLEAIKTGPYGRCVYKCDNNVCDHQLTIMTFENGVKAMLNTNAFTGNEGRIFRLNGTLGEIQINEEEGYVRLKKYGKDEPETWKIDDLIAFADTHHGGGDAGLLAALYDCLSGASNAGTTLEDAVESHLIGFAAEQSRKNGGILVKVHE